jgi:RNA polymerase primary sigma factor
MNGSASQHKPTLGSFFRMAIIAGVESAVRIHIERGDNLNARDAGGQTPLMLAAARNKPHIFKLLLAAGADPLLTDSDGKTALLIANAAGAREIGSLLEPAFPPSLEAVPAYDTSPFPADEAPSNDDLISVAEATQLDIPNQPALPDPAVNAPSLSEIVESDPTLLPLDTDYKEDNGWSAASIPATADVIDFDENGATLDLSGWEAEVELRNVSVLCALDSISADSAMSKVEPFL